jgi:hypothetical protein
VGVVNLALIAAGIALIAIGWTRARRPWQRYQGLKEQQANVERYESWRGGLRGSPGERTGADVMMQELRRQAQIAGAVVIVGFVVLVLGFFLR